uniref:Zgc:109744 n=1 Tax=Tetraodon nigroviridis TaxID=99883 RepID=H3BZZ1_TETNG
MEEHADFSLGGKAVVNETNDNYYWKLLADFIGPQSGEGLKLQKGQKTGVLIQVGLLREENNFPWIAILDWLKKIFPSHQSADFRCLIERAWSLENDARQSFLESNVNFNFVGPVCDSIGVERKHLLELKDFTERAQSVEVTNGLILELSNFVDREKLAPIVIVTWLRNFNPEFCKNGNIQRAYQVLRGKIKRLKFYSRNFATRSHRRSAAMESLLQSPFELVKKKAPKLAKKRIKKDKLPNFHKFVNLSESATSRYIHMVCDILSTQTPSLYNYRKHWVAFCDEKKNTSKLTTKLSNRFNRYYEAAAALVHHYKEIPLFFSDLLTLNSDANVVVESIAADATDSVIQSFVCVLAIIYCKILGPYWQLLKSGAEYSLYSHYLLCLYQRFLDWSKDPSSLLEPEESTNVFLQYPLQEKTFQGVFEYCGQWHTNRDLIRACLKRMVKVISAVTESHLKDFLPGGKLFQIPSLDLSLQLSSCTFAVLMAQYPFGHAFPYERERSSK